MADENTQYQIGNMESGVCETLPVDSKFAGRLMRGGQNNPKMYVTTQQATALKKYVPMTQWGKDERVVYIIMQNYMDNVGAAPTASQIAAISLAGQGTSVEENAASRGLSAARVQRALSKLQKRGIVFES